MSRRHGVTENTVKKIMIDAGALYFNYGESTEQLVGATRGGCTFAVETEYREMPMDGAKGPVKGGRRITRVVARITANVLEWNAELLAKALPGATIQDYGTTLSPEWERVTRALTLTDANYMVNVAIVGQVSGSSDPVVCGIKNAIADGNLEIATIDNDESAPTVQFTGHFTPADLNSEPWWIDYPVVSTTTAGA
jgi:hypothetical protein